MNLVAEAISAESDSMANRNMMRESDQLKKQRAKMNEIHDRHEIGGKLTWRQKEEWRP